MPFAKNLIKEIIVMFLLNGLESEQKTAGRGETG